jgi:sulfoquinovose isomerase
VTGDAARAPGLAVFDPASPAHPGWLRGEVGELLRFGAAAADWRAGGFDGLTTTGLRQPGPKQLYVTARMTYGYALGALLGRPGCAELARHGLRALRTIFRDDADGGWFAELSEDGREVRAARKETYGHAFVLLAASTAAQAGLPAGDLAQEAAEIFDRWLYDEPAHLCVDSFDRGWAVPDSYRGMNANMHAVEAFLSAYGATGQQSFLQRARAISERLIGFAGAAQWRVPEHFTRDWEPLPDYHADRRDDRFRPFGATPGHGIEWARLLLQLRLAPGGDAGGLLAAATGLFGRAVADAWDPGRCGFAYTVDWQGREVSSQRLHWPLAEAVGAARYLLAATGDAQYARWYTTFWELADRCFRDRRGGSWWHEIGVDGRPGSTIWAGKSDLYHVLNALLLSLLPPGPAVGAALVAAAAG